ncbi:MAG TPA: ATP-binding protein [Polyangia bacterium]|jgi:signal transduction histidine kinase|nr:ATP-binding protein [Polyangia bacterium]
MTLRSKLLLAQAPTVLAVIAVGVLASVTNGKLARSSELILKDNYRSVLAAQRMKEAIERVDSAALFLVAGEEAAGLRQAEQYVPLFERELKAQEGNITEVGEQQATTTLRARWDLYRRRLGTFTPLATEVERRRAYFAELQPAFLAVKDGADVILAINQDAMLRKSERARRMADRLDAATIAAATAACLLGLLSSLVLTTRLLRPLGILRQAARRLGEGDSQARARVSGRDEIAEVAGEFNTMADRLAQYRQSSLGELIAAQQQSQAAIDSLPDPVLIFDAERHLVAVNHAAEQNLRVTLDTEADDPLAPAPPEVRATVDRLAAQMLAGRGAYQPRGLEDALRTAAAGQEVFLLPRATPVLSEKGGVIGAAILLQDVTRLMRFDELKSNLVATVAHEFRTPLTSLRMALHLCLEQAVGPITEKQADLLFAARQDTERLQQIVDDLLDLSRIQSGHMELNRRAVDAATLARDAVKAFAATAEARGIDLRVELMPSLGEVVADPERIALAFDNLIGNAIKYTPAGGRVTVSAESHDHAVRFAIQDTGPGVPPEHRQAIFERFFRMPGATEPGAGLGLYIAKEIVDAHGGRIGVDGEPGQGSTFWLELPVESA